MKTQISVITILALAIIPNLGRGVFADKIDVSTKVGLFVRADTAAVTPQGVMGGLSISTPSHTYLTQIKALQKSIQDKIDAENARVAAQEAARQAEIEREAFIASQSSNAISGGYVQPVYTSSCSDAKSCIYDRESGNNPASTNAGGCFGIGQDCNNVLRNQCGVDYACQDVFFTRYAFNRYGSWENAWVVWQSQGWW